MSKFNVTRLLIFLFENMAKVRNFLHTFCWLIKSAVFCIFHFIPRMFCSFTQHCYCCLYIFTFSGLRSCWSECLGSACSTTLGGKGCEQIIHLGWDCNFPSIWPQTPDPKTINTFLAANLPRMTVDSISNLQLIFEVQGSRRYSGLGMGRRALENFKREISTSNFMSWVLKNIPPNISNCYSYCNRFVTWAVWQIVCAILFLDK